MKIGNVTIDASDVGNGCLIVGTGVAFYGASAGNPCLLLKLWLLAEHSKRLLQRSITTYSKNQKPQKLNNFLFGSTWLTCGAMRDIRQEQKWTTATKMT